MHKKSPIQAGLELIRLGHQMIAEAEISSDAVIESVNRARMGDYRLMRKLEQKPGYDDLIQAIYCKNQYE